MLSESAVWELLEAYRSFKPYRMGWLETDRIPVSQVCKCQILLLEQLLELRPKGGLDYATASIAYCREHEIISASDETCCKCVLDKKEKEKAILPAPGDLVPPDC